MTARWLILGLLGVTLWSTTSQRVRVWTEDRRLWTDAVAKAPHKPRPWVNLGNAFAREGFHPAARAAYQRAQQLARNPQRPRGERVSADWYASDNLARLERAAHLEEWLRAQSFSASR